MNARRLAILIMAGAGVLIAVYLTVLHYDTNAPLVCVGQGGIINCGDVLTSPESVVMGIPVPLWGLFWFVVVGVLAWLSPTGEGIRRFLMAWSVAGGIVVIYLVYVEFDVLHHVCIWCSALHALILAVLALQVVEAGQRPAS